jgi:hypothetical protein
MFLLLAFLGYTMRPAEDAADATEPADTAGASTT